MNNEIFLPGIKIHVIALPGILVFCGVCAFLHCLYFVLIFLRLGLRKKKVTVSDETPAVSIIVCAKNERQNLEKNLVHLLNQRYAKFEVIVVNDFSSDGSDEFLLDMSKRFAHLYHTNITQEARVLSGKKFALTIGMKAAQYDYVLLTDADCTPAGEHWLQNMMYSYTPGRDIVLGYAPYRKHAGMLNKIIRFETFYTAMQYLGYAVAGMPYMGVGRNLSYKRRVFFDNNIFVKHPRLASGDDDLMINAAATAANTAIQLNPESFVYSEPKTTYEEWWYQKTRHLSTARYYKTGHKIVLSLFSLLHVLTYLSILAVCLYTPYYQIALLIWAVRMLITGTVTYVAMRRLQETDLIWYYPFFDVALLIYYIIFTPATLIKPSQRWK